MHATVRRYEGIDQTKKDELTRKVEESLMPTLSKLPGFNGYFLIDAKDLDEAIAIATRAAPPSRPTAEARRSPTTASSTPDPENSWARYCRASTLSTGRATSATRSFRRAPRNPTR